MKTNISLNDSIHFWDQTAHKIKDDNVKKLMKVMKCENELQVMVYHSVTWYACLHFIKRKLKPLHVQLVDIPRHYAICQKISITELYANHKYFTLLLHVYIRNHTIAVQMVCDC